MLEASFGLEGLLMYLRFFQFLLALSSKKHKGKPCEFTGNSPIQYCQPVLTSIVLEDSICPGNETEAFDRYIKKQVKTIQSIKIIYKEFLR
jgi:hypothetical protein